MARTKAILGTGARMSDYLSASLLARVYPAKLVAQIIEQHGATSKRQRSMPALVTAYYCMAMNLYPEAAYEQVFEVVGQGLARMEIGHAPLSAVKSSISAARTKLGVEPLKTLYKSACLPLCEPVAQSHAFYKEFRLVAIDGSTFDVPDETANAAEFARPGCSGKPPGYPQARCAILVECASHAVIDANLGSYSTSEQTLAQPILARMDCSMLCLADRAFGGYKQWVNASASGAQLLWRCLANRVFPAYQYLPDGSYLSAIYPDRAALRRKMDGIPVRILDYGLPGSQERYRLVTTLLDPVRAPALELAQLYQERWEVEGVFDELKTHLHGKRRTLRSKTPQGVRQEFYGWLLMHYAVCWLMHQGASAHRLKARQLSFTGHIHLFKAAQRPQGASPPTAGTYA